MTVKMPEPITAPMPSAVRDQGPNDFFSACSGSSDSRISLSIDLQETSWLRREALPFWSDSDPGTAARAMRGKAFRDATWSWRGREGGSRMGETQVPKPGTWGTHAGS